MCLIAFAWRTHHRYPLALIANRDEFHLRPSAAAGFDPEAAVVYGGRDLVRGGSWLQVSKRGRLATVTNVRAGPKPEEAPRSRGWLVRDFVRGDGEAVEYAAALESTAGEHGRFNLLLWDGAELVFASNHPDTYVHGRIARAACDVERRLRCALAQERPRDAGLGRVAGIGAVRHGRDRSDRADALVRRTGRHYRRAR